MHSYSHVFTVGVFLCCYHSCILAITSDYFNVCTRPALDCYWCGAGFFVMGNPTPSRLTQAAQSSLAPFQRFALSLQQDYDAIKLWSRHAPMSITLCCLTCS